MSIKTDDEETVFQELIHAIGKLRYGSVEITVHDGRVVQIETREKKRFDKAERQS